MNEGLIMAYLNFNEAGFAAVVRTQSRPLRDTSAVVADASLSLLEWSVVALARRDRIARWVAPRPLRAIFGFVFGHGFNRSLADERLEALRRMAALLWRRDTALPTHEEDAFRAAGFTDAQRDLVARSIAARRHASGQAAFA
jgi:hypothetical protein